MRACVCLSQCDRLSATVYIVMHRFAMGPAVVTVKHEKKVVEHVHAGTLERELQDAINYCQDAITHPDWMLVVGNA